MQMFGKHDPAKCLRRELVTRVTIEELNATVSALGKDLFKRLSDMGEHFSRVGLNLGRAVEAYNSAVGSLESRVMVSARRFAELKTAPLGVEIAALEPVEKNVRSLQGEPLQ